jgi:hypothetical protein
VTIEFKIIDKKRRENEDPGFLSRRGNLKLRKDELDLRMNTTLDFFQTDPKSRLGRVRKILDQSSG